MPVPIPIPIRRGFVALALAALAPLGCGGGSAEQKVVSTKIEAAQLSQLGELYRAHTIEKKGPPKKLADALPYEPGYPVALAGIRNGEVQVYWGGALSNPEAEAPGATPSDLVLAYETKVPKEGGYVLLADRSLKTMTPAEFQAAPKAAAESSGAPAAKKGKP